VHVREKYPCKFCEFESTTKVFITRHVIVFHKKVRYNCSQCSFQASDKGYIRKHMKAKHEGITYNCEICDYKAGFKDTLSHHMRYTHSGQEFPCDKCPLKYINRHSLKRHVVLKHTKSKESNVLQLKQKSKMKEIVKEPQIVICDKCNKQYENQSKLKIHQRKVHSGSVYCDICNAKFSAVSPMNLHKNSKHEGLNFPCLNCKHTSTQKGDLLKHIQSKHSKPKYNQVRQEDKQAKKKDEASEYKITKTKQVKKIRPRERRMTHQYKQTMRSIVADFTTK
jgi:KRAB domain-containing zinc finger protein